MKIRNNWQRWCVLTLIIGLMLACLPGEAQAQAKPPLKIGLSTTLTGPSAAGGKSALLALQIWRDDVNAKGGLLGRKVELVYYDDQNSAGLTPAIFAKLLDVDKVDLLIGPYGTVATGPIIPFAKQRGKLLMGNFSNEGNRSVKYDMYFSNNPMQNDVAYADFFKLGKNIGAKTVGFLSVDQDFGQTAVRGARENAAATGLKTVYDQRYPPNLTDFSAMIQSIRAAKPDVVFISCYPYHSIYIVRAVREMGVGPSVKVLGGAIIGLQYGTTLESLGSALNGFVNVHVYVPEKTMAFPGLEDFLTRYAKQAREGGVDPLGFWLAPSNYAIGQMLEQAITATKSFNDRVLANYLHTHVMKTVAGPIQFDKEGEWATPRSLMIQFRGVVNHNLEQFRHPGKQVILAPDQYKTGDLIWPFEKASQ